MFGDVQDERQKEVAALERKLDIAQQRILEVENARDDEKDKNTKLRRKYSEVLEKLETKGGIILKLTARINRDYENLSMPSSKSVRNKKISNSREQTKKKPRGQPGHKGVKDTPVEDYRGILVHDHDKTFHTMVQTIKSVLLIYCVI